MDPVLGALVVFLLRICDVSVGTLRMLSVVRGRKWAAAGLGVLESGIFIVAISTVFSNLDSPLSMIGYAMGFATGTLVGMTLEEWIGTGEVLMRVISRTHSEQVRRRVLDEGFGLTAVRGEGHRAEVTILFIVCPRRRGEQLLQLVRQIDPDAFVTSDPVTRAAGGYLPHAPAPAGVRK